jgi:hypothetical protein
MDNESIPYRSGIPALTPAPTPAYSKDESEESTLRSVYRDLKKAMDEIDQWHAFDLGKNNGLTIAQQIVAHQKAYDIVAPAFDSVKSALALIDNKYKE